MSSGGGGNNGGGAVINNGGYGNQSSPYGHPQASLSYTVHPQMLLSPNGHHHNGHQSQMQNGNYATLTNGSGGGSSLNGGAQSYYECQHPPPPPPPPPSMYPSMSVNVSMNMTMHGYGGSEANVVPMQCSQVEEILFYLFPISLLILFSSHRCNGHHIKIPRHHWTSCTLRCSVRIIIIQAVPPTRLRPTFGRPQRAPNPRSVRWWIHWRFLHRLHLITKLIMHHILHLNLRWCPTIK